MKPYTNIKILAPLLCGAATLPGILVKTAALPAFLSQPINVQTEQASFIPPLLWWTHQVFGDDS
jgi:hypothetical protein